jgi:hypothetical protein
MSSPSPMAPPTFPSQEEFARTLLVEALRHLEDARVLHHAARLPASVTSAMKAAEIGSKSVLILDGAMGWWEKLLSTHAPLNEIAGHPVLRRHHSTLAQYDAKLLGDAKEMERLAPTRPGAGAFEIRAEANPEYPFPSVEEDASSGMLRVRLHEPAQHFTEADSRHSYGVARDLLAAFQALYPGIQAWGFTLPDPL